MVKKVRSKTGFRNGKPMCFNCGAVMEMTLPMAVTAMTSDMRDFDKKHKDCKPTWKVPVPPRGLSVKERAAWWMEGMNGERGMSSQAIWFTMMDQNPNYRYAAHPADPDDLRRCYLLLQLIPEWGPILMLMKPISPQWERLVTEWDALMWRLQEQLTGKRNDLYEIMQKVYKGERY